MKKIEKKKGGKEKREGIKKFDGGLILSRVLSGATAGNPRR